MLIATTIPTGTRLNLPMQEHIFIRSMRQDDFDAIMQIQAACYFGSIPESRDSLFAKFAASPTSCFVAQQETQLLAYLFAIPWKIDFPPQLNAQQCDLPDMPDCMYLHDLAVAPTARGRRLGQHMLYELLNTLPSYGLTQLCLVAVQGSSRFWYSQGFSPVNANGLLKLKLDTYGEDAFFMARSTV